jgi:flavin reductase (DIM6/NTAB) family NADH-FMN oxidoreductase RutF
VTVEGELVTVVVITVISGHVGVIVIVKPVSVIVSVNPYNYNLEIISKFRKFYINIPT